MQRASVWRYFKAYDGDPTEENIQLRDEVLPRLQNGEILVEAEFLSVDPYMRILPPPLGDPMLAEQVARVIDSKNPKYSVGTKLLINCGWRSHTILDPTDTKTYRIKKLHPGLRGLPESLALGTVGMPGATAYFALFKTLKIQRGKTILINAAAGAVGQVAGQIAKIKGLKVIGAAGSKEKCDFLKEIGFDIVINYKTEDLDAALKKAAPQGFDYYLDMVGGNFTTTVIKNHMVQRGVICSIGNISGYNKLVEGEVIWGNFFFKELRLEGLFIFSDQHTEQEWFQAFNNITTWIKEGRLKYNKEDVTAGFNNMRTAFFGLFTGANLGKAIVKV